MTKVTGTRSLGGAIPPALAERVPLCRGRTLADGNGADMGVKADTEEPVGIAHDAGGSEEDNADADAAARTGTTAAAAPASEVQGHTSDCGKTDAGAGARDTTRHINSTEPRGASAGITTKTGCGTSHSAGGTPVAATGRATVTRGAAVADTATTTSGGESTSRLASHHNVAGSTAATTAGAAGAGVADATNIAMPSDTPDAHGGTPGVGSGGGDATATAATKAVTLEAKTSSGRLSGPQQRRRRRGPTRSRHGEP